MLELSKNQNQNHMELEHKVIPASPITDSININNTFTLDEIIHCSFFIFYKDISRSNAYLIANTPELLEAFHNLYIDLDFSRSIGETLRKKSTAILNKAIRNQNKQILLDADLRLIREEDGYSRGDFYKLVGMVGNWLTLDKKVGYEMYQEFKEAGYGIFKK